jgi:hypothetical protein
MSAHLTPDLQQTRRYLEVLGGGTKETFQLFSDKEELKRVLPGGKLCDPHASWRHGSFDALALHLARQNAEGAGIYVMVNRGNGKGRTAGNVQLVRTFFLDTDGAALPAHFPLKPHIIVESSPGKFHVYWLVTGLELEHFSIYQQALAEHYGTDPSVKDLPRCMRLPGFFHRKGEPVMVQLLEAHDHRPYTVAEVYAAWPFLPERLEQARALEAEKEQRRAEIVRRAAERKAGPTTDTGDQARAERLLQAHHDTVAAAGDGTRHDTLLRSARALGGYVGGGYLDAEEVEAVLLAAAEVCGLPDAEAADVIRWGLDRGADDPLELAPPTSFDARQASGAKAIALKETRSGQAKPLLVFSCTRFSCKPKLGSKPCL